MDVVSGSISGVSFTVKYLSALYDFANVQIGHIVIMTYHYSHIVHGTVGISHRVAAFKPDKVSISGINLLDNTGEGCINYISSTILSGKVKRFCTLM